MNEIVQWLISLPQLFAQFGQWLTEPLPYINMSPLAVFGVTGITAVIAIKLLRLFVGG